MPPSRLHARIGRVFFSKWVRFYDFWLSQTYSACSRMSWPQATSARCVRRLARRTAVALSLLLGMVRTRSCVRSPSRITCNLATMTSRQASSFGYTYPLHACSRPLLHASVPKLPPCPKPLRTCLAITSSRVPHIIGTSGTITCLTHSSLRRAL